MPQFIPHGPIVPDELVQGVEDDRVVIFCGAGISMGAGLPSYRGLVEHCHQELTHPLPQAEREWDWPDRMLGALESRYTAERVRAIVTRRLSQRARDLSLHKAILRLAKLRRCEGVRLVTTNFDIFFESAARSLRQRIARHSGPVLPIPRNDRMASWRSLVYLHGRLGDAPTEQLVLTSADFGRAYLTEAWAARFVARLFADFSVLFIGYSLNDPVLRYMTDAFAAEDADMRSRQPRGPAYIFTPVADGEAPDPQSFVDRNLSPIFYSSTQQHIRLKETIVAWAEARDDYLASVRRLINQIAPRRPDAIDPTDTANLLWAVAGRPDDDGHGARVFASVATSPPIEWFDSLEAREADQQRDYETACLNAQQAGRRPPAAPQYHLRALFPSALDSRELGLNQTSVGLIEWLVRHLATEGLAHRVLSKFARGLSLHAQLRRAIRHQMATDTSLPLGYAHFWRIIASEGGWLAHGDSMPVGPAWVVREAAVSTPYPEWLRQELLAALRPLLKLSPSSYREFASATGSSDEPITTLSQVANAEIVFAESNFIPSMLQAMNSQPVASALWSEALDELTSLLVQALRLYDVAGRADASTDPSVFERPSIKPHAQNHIHRQWTLLFDLIWQGWFHLDATDEARSRAIIERWRRLPYLAFRRLVLAAVTASSHFTPAERIEALLDG